MIDKEKTIATFGYDIDNLVHKSGKKVVHLCDKCGSERNILYKDAIKKAFYICRKCTIEGKNNYFHTHRYEKEKNCNYLDGRSSRQHYCKYSGCTNKICFSTIYNSGYCRKHSRLGNLNGKYIDGRTQLTTLIRNLKESKKWSFIILKRDAFRCTQCNLPSSGHLTAHHVKSFRRIMSEFLAYYKDLNPITDKHKLVELSLTWPDFWDINNGITLCEDCHKKAHIKKEK
jgi:5-methylcytosine-specific restriction endonuclease McrA